MCARSAPSNRSLVAGEQKNDEVKEKGTNAVEETILDILIPTCKKSAGFTSGNATIEVS